MDHVIDFGTWVPYVHERYCTLLPCLAPSLPRSFLFPSLLLSFFLAEGGRDLCKLTNDVLDNQPMVLFVLSAVVDIDMWNRDGQTTDSDTETERDVGMGKES